MELKCELNVLFSITPLTDKTPQQYSVYKAFLVFFGLINTFYNKLFTVSKYVKLLFFDNLAITFCLYSRGKKMYTFLCEDKYS